VSSRVVFGIDVRERDCLSGAATWSAVSGAWHQESSKRPNTHEVVPPDWRNCSADLVTLVARKASHRLIKNSGAGWNILPGIGAKGGILSH